MSDVVTLARTARESLARGLDALQADPNVPPPLRELGAQVAQAMGALYQIESSGGAKLAQYAPGALAGVQAALAQLQAQPSQHPAVMSAMEAVAGALSGLHALTRAAQQPAQGYAPAPAQPYAAQQPYAPQQYAPAPAAQPVAPQPRTQPQPAYPQQPQAAPPAQPQPAQARPAPAMPAGDSPVVTAELGAHSPTNFYKGLSGNDIVDHGGLFVSTYKLPKLGTPVRLKVSLPGGYEFEANAVVRWRREASDGAGDAPPGFGAQFTEITQEARQLVYRYVRNREPMFHDDL